MKKLVFWLMLLSVVFSQNDTTILSKISKQYDGVKDFQGKMQVITDVPNFRMPIKTVHLFYKAPDKMKMKVKGFALLPKNGILPFMYLKKLESDSIGIDTIYTKNINKKEMTFVSIADTSVLKGAQILLSIDTYLERIESVIITHEQDTVSTINFTYQNIDGFWMPETTEFNFNMEKRLPMASGPSITNPFGSIDIGSADDHFQNNGKVSLIFHEVRVNTNLDDALFIEEK